MGIIFVKCRKKRDEGNKSEDSEIIHDEYPKFIGSYENKNIFIDKNQDDGKYYLLNQMEITSDEVKYLNEVKGNDTIKKIYSGEKEYCARKDIEELKKMIEEIRNLVMENRIDRLENEVNVLKSDGEFINFMDIEDRVLNKSEISSDGGKNPLERSMIING